MIEALLGGAAAALIGVAGGVATGRRMVSGSFVQAFSGRVERVERQLRSAESSIEELEGRPASDVNRDLVVSLLKAQRKALLDEVVTLMEKAVDQSNRITDTGLAAAEQRAKEHAQVLVDELDQQLRAVITSEVTLATAELISRSEVQQAFAQVAQIEAARIKEQQSREQQLRQQQVAAQQARAQEVFGSTTPLMRGLDQQLAGLNEQLNGQLDSLNARLAEIRSGAGPALG